MATKPRAEGAPRGVYGPTVTREEYRRDPMAVMRKAAKRGAITIVDANGTPQAVISAPAPVERKK